MKSPALFFAVSLLSLLSVAGSALSDRGSEREAYPDLFEPYSDQLSRRAPYADYADYGDWSTGLGGADGLHAPRKAPRGDSDPYRTDAHQAPQAGPYVDPVLDGGYAGYPMPYDQAPYGGDRVGPHDAAAAWGYRDPDQSAVRRRFSPTEANGYRFRGDDPAGFGRWGAAPYRKGYRFRPLTEQERRRLGSGTRWRPREPEHAGERPRRPDPLPDREAYGYRSENWFNRYYGGRR